MLFRPRSGRRLAILFMLLLFPTSSILAAASPETAASPRHGWTLAQAVEFALEHSPDLHMALQRLQAAGAMIEVAGSFARPTLTLGGEYSQTDMPMLSFGNILNQGAFDDSIDFNDPGRTDSLALQAMLASVHSFQQQPSSMQGRPVLAPSPGDAAWQAYVEGRGVREIATGLHAPRPVRREPERPRCIPAGICQGGVIS